MKGLLRKFALRKRFALFTSNSPTAMRYCRVIAIVAAVLAWTSSVSRADEQLFGFVRGAETLPKNHFELYQFITLRTGKQSGTYYGTDFDTEIEYGFTDRLQASLSVVNHYFYNDNVPDLDDSNRYRFGGLETSAKYRVLSPFKRSDRPGATRGRWIPLEGRSGRPSAEGILHQA